MSVVSIDDSSERRGGRAADRGYQKGGRNYGRTDGPGDCKACGLTPLSAATMQASLWLTGNRLPLASAARAPARIPRGNFRISTKRRGTRWWRSNWRNFSRPRVRVLTRRNGIPRQQKDFAVPIGGPKRRKPQPGLVPFRAKCRRTRQPSRGTSFI